MLSIMRWGSADVVPRLPPVSSLLPIVRDRSFQGEHGSGYADWLRKTENAPRQSSHIQNPEQPRGCEPVVGPVESAELAK